MAKANRTTSKKRRATAAKATKRAPIKWGYENGQQVVLEARGAWGRALPFDRLRGLRNVINDMAAVVEAFDCAIRLKGDAKLTMLCMSATVGRQLMVEAAEDMRAVLVLSPALREAFSREDARMAKAEGGAV